MDVLRLLKSKNKCLQKFLDISTHFLAEAQKGDFSCLEAFEKDRTATLKAFDLFDRKITEAVALIPQAKRDQVFTDQIGQALEEKRRLIHLIMGVDDQIIAKIEEEKANLMRELSESEKSKNLVKKFKSSWVTESGEELDETL